MTENNDTPDIIVFDFDYLFNMLHKHDNYYYKLSTLLLMSLSTKYFRR